MLNFHVIVQPFVQKDFFDIQFKAENIQIFILKTKYVLKMKSVGISKKYYHIGIGIFMSTQ